MSERKRRESHRKGLEEVRQDEGEVETEGDGDGRGGEREWKSLGSCRIKKEKRRRWCWNRKSIVGWLFFSPAVLAAQLNLEGYTREIESKTQPKIRVRLSQRWRSRAEALSHCPCVTPINLQVMSEVKNTCASCDIFNRLFFWWLQYIY